MTHQLKIAIIVSLVAVGCKKNNKNISSGNDPNFTIVKNENPDLKKFNRKVEVFGIPIYAVKKVDDHRLLHAANIMAQYLDNDEDGEVDNPKVVEKMKANQAFMVMWKSQRDLNGMSGGSFGQDLGNDETRPEWHSGNKSGQFDASLEEVFHIITHAGYSQVYSDAFAESAGSELAKAMDIARGGHFQNIPSTYPAGAWYTYDDKTCGYDCMATEYFYWAMTSLLGAQTNRLNEIQQEWKLNTEEKLKNQDPAIYNLLTDPEYKFPQTLPDGTYKR